MQFDQLKCFIAVAETKSFSKAAQQLFMTQQAVSNNIKKLELDLDCELFFRTKTGVVLTIDGEAVLEYAYQIFEQQDILTQKIKNNRDFFGKTSTDSYTLKISSCSPVLNNLLPELIGKLERKSNHKTILKLHTVDLVDAVLEHLDIGIAELGFVTFRETDFYAKFEKYQNNLTFDILHYDKIVAVMNRTPNVEQSPSVTMKTVWKTTCTQFNIVPVDMYQDEADDFFVASTNDIEFHRKMIKELNAVVLMPKLAYDMFFANKRYIMQEVDDVTDTPLIHAAIYRKDNIGTNGFLAMLKKDFLKK